MKSRLYSPGYIGSLKIKNRIIMTAMHSALSNGGEVNSDLIEYFAERARGGVGLIIVGASGIDPQRVNTHNVIGVYDDKFILGLSRLSKEIHSYKSSCFLQLFHPGRYGRSQEYNNIRAVAPSELPSGFTGETPRELSEKEILEIVEYYGLAAERAVKAGFDGVEITAASGYLPAQFLSAVTNLRTDRYGNGLDGRLIFLKEVIKEVRLKTGSIFPVTIRIGGNDLIPGGNNSEDALYIARALENEGVNAISVTGGWHESRVPQLTMDVPTGILTCLAKKIRNTIDIPLILSNRLTPRIAEELVDSDLIDFAGFGRALLADPAMPSKAAEERYDSIRPCIGCNQGCMDRIFFGKSISCLVNPEAGREAKVNKTEIEKISNKDSEQMLIIGAGVSGLNFAIEASLRGYRPTVWEKDSIPGGQAMIASGVDERKEISKYLSYLQHICKDREIPIITGKKAEKENILQAVHDENYDRIILATGKEAVESDLKTDGTIPVIHGWDVLRGAAVPGCHIVIKGGNYLGIWAALKLAARGRMTAEQFRFFNLYGIEKQNSLKAALTELSGEITIIEKEKKPGKGMSKSSKWIYLSLLKRFGIKVLTKQEILSIDLNSVQSRDKAGKQQSLKADILIETSSFTYPGKDLLIYLQKEGINASLIGEVLNTGNMLSAIKSGFSCGRSI